MKNEMRKETMWQCRGVILLNIGWLGKALSRESSKI